MSREQKILNETCPYLREVWALGFDELFQDDVLGILKLVHSNGQVVEKDQREFQQFILSLKIIIGISPDPIKSDFHEVEKQINAGDYSNAKKHKWIAEGNGDAKRFRDYLMSEINIS